MLSKFYVVQKNGIPAVWQSDPERIVRLLKHKAGFKVLSERPSDTRAEALIKLREAFPDPGRSSLLRRDPTRNPFPQAQVRHTL